MTEETWAEVADPPRRMSRRELFWNGVLGGAAPWIGLHGSADFIGGAVTEYRPVLALYGAAQVAFAWWIGRDAVRAYRRGC